MSKPSRTTIVVATLIILVVAVLTLIAGSTLFVMRHVEIEPGTRESAKSAFDRTRHSSQTAARSSASRILNASDRASSSTPRCPADALS